MRAHQATMMALSLIGLFGWVPRAVAQPEHEQPNVPDAQAPAVESVLPGGESALPSSEEVHRVITRYLDDLTEEEGAFYLDDEVTGELRELQIVKIREDVKTLEPDYFAAHVEMRDVGTQDLLDIDFELERYENELEVADVIIHTVNGVERSDAADAAGL